MDSILLNRSEETTRTVAFGLLISAALFSMGLFYYNVVRPFVTQDLIRHHGSQLVEVRGVGHVRTGG